MNTSENQIYERIVFQYRASQVQTIIEWLESTRKEIGNQLRSVPAKKQNSAKTS
jgi:hypothetical protein